MKSDYIVVKLSNVLDNVEHLSTTEGDEYECITIENLKGLSDQTEDSARQVLKNAGYLVDVLWSKDDILFQAANDDVTLTENQVDEVADRLQDEFDANYGINWDTISMRIQEVLEDEKKGA